MLAAIFLRITNELACLLKYCSPESRLEDIEKLPCCFYSFGHAYITCYQECCQA